MWANLATRLSIVPGKEILRLFRAEVERLYSVTLTDIRIIDAYAIGEIPEDISQLIQSLENCRTEGIN